MSPLYDPDRMRGFWITPNKENTPSTYAQADPRRSRFLVRLIDRLVPAPRTILELGCNCGRNLQALQDAGYTHLYGADLKDCSVEMQQFFPQLRCYTWWGPWEYIPFAEYDLIYTMATMQHIHDDGVLDAVATMARMYVITVEDEKTGWPMHVPRNYRKEFKRRGFVETRRGETKALPGYTARVFRRKGI